MDSWEELRPHPVAEEEWNWIGGGMSLQARYVDSPEAINVNRSQVETGRLDKIPGHLMFS